jgi:competence protein ComEA
MDYYKLKVLNNKKKIIVVISILVIIISLCYYFFIYTKEEDEVIDTIEEVESEVINDKNDLIVDIKGHVKNPGVYSFKESDNARIINLIEKAGGLLKDADTSTINLSKKIEDEMIIIIYSKSEITNYVKTQDDLKKKLEICENKLKNDGCIKESVTNTKININEASISELESLNGIGKTRAEAIVEYRKKSRFKTIEEIMNVDGIGESLFANIKENITV